MKTAGHIRNLRKYPWVLHARNLLAQYGATDVEITIKGHIHVRWTINGRPTHITMPCSPRTGENATDWARQAIRRRYGEAGVALP